VGRALADPLSTSPATSSHLIAAGKAADAMAATILERESDRISSGLIVVPSGTVVTPGRPTPKGVDVIEAGHPVPDEGSQKAGIRALEIAASAPADGSLVVLISGGASSLLAAPAEGLTLEDKQSVTRLLLQAGADIRALNTVRKHLSRVKGGLLAAACPGAIQTLAISDVVGDDPSAIASGPTVADPTSFHDALSAVGRYGVRDQMPASVLRHLEAGARGERPETPKPNDPRLARSTFRLVGRARDAVDGAKTAAESLGYAVAIRTEPVVGEAREAARSQINDVAGLLRGMPRPACILSSGETTVTVKGSGRGGRNQEFALACVQLIGSLGAAAVVASIGTDGVDGPTDAAGAIADTASLDRAGHAGLGTPASFLDHNDAFTFFSALGDLVRTGPTGTNVGDIQIVLVA
jgi:hydroxypyruvate reductase